MFTYDQCHRNGVIGVTYLVRKHFKAEVAHGIVKDRESIKWVQ